MRNWKLCNYVSQGSLVVVCTIAASASLGVSKGQGVDFTTDVRPILGKCASCHGGVKKSAGFSVLSREMVLAATNSGRSVVVVGDADASELVHRISSRDPDEQMPPDEPLDKREIDIMRRWIEQGMPWPAHWAYMPLNSEKQPEPQTYSSPNSIDEFVQHRLASIGKTQSPEANRRTLIRRLSLDLTGLLPTAEEVHIFVHDSAADAYSRLVDRLLESQHYGERWGRHWLDEARYADSEGYEKDTPKKDAYRFRDWVIDALNDDMPFDQFTIRQIAGDLLPNRTQADLIATKFHLQSQFNLEGGVDAEEDRTKRVIDRVSTVGTVWLASTIGCSQCHDHPYDPFSQRDFYRLYAFFNNADITADIMDNSRTDAEEVRTERRKKADKLSNLLERQVANKNLNFDAQVALVDIRDFDNRKNFVRYLKERDSKPRTTYVFRRGDFLQPLQEDGEVVPGTPSILPAIQSGGDEPGRLDFANWLVASENPLVARADINKVWMHLFGKPLAANPGDFGSRGEPPSHPELLDWLAHWYIKEAKWSRKALIREIVNSKTYRQASLIRLDLADIDPANRLLARQNRFRVEAEIMRDMALQAGGLLCLKVGGPSVFPPLPDIVAMQTYAGQFKYSVSKGCDRHRRGVYTFFRRTAIDPNLATFDCTDASVSKAERERSNNAIQALTTLQNEVFIEATQGFAKRLLKLDLSTENPDRDRLIRTFEISLSREPNAAELRILRRLLGEAREYYGNHPIEADELVGEHAASHVDLAENAAWIVVCRAVLNLDEFFTRN